MKNALYLPSKDKDRVVWLKNFSVEFAVYAASLGFTASEIAAVARDAAFFEFIVFVATIALHEKEEKIKYKNIVAEGPIGYALGVMPAPVVYPATPTAVPAGIFPRNAKIIQRIKNHPDYNEATGKAMGIIGSEEFAVAREEFKPILNLSISGDAVKVKWTKGHADSIHIEVDRGNGAGWVFLAKDTSPDYLDTTSFPENPSKWKYRAMYELHDELVGQWSDVVIINRYHKY